MGFKLGNFAVVCQNCKGRGELIETSGSSGMPGMGVMTSQRTCDCDRGYVYTEAGKDLQDLLRFFKSRI